LKTLLILNVDNWTLKKKKKKEVFELVHNAIDEASDYYLLQ